MLILKKKKIVCLFQLLEKNKDQISTEIAKQEELSKKLQTANIDYEGKYFKTSSHGSGDFCCSALDKLLGQLGIYATLLSSIVYLQKQLRIFIFFFTPRFFSVIYNTRFLIA